MRPAVPTEQRYWAMVDKSGGPEACWEWTGHRNAAGYGMFWSGGRRPSGTPICVRAHRWAHQRYVRPLGAEECVLHHCDNPPCQNPAHLFIGTRKDNAIDRESKGRGSKVRRGLRGEQNHQAKLTAAQVQAIRDRHAAGSVMQKTIAEEFGVSRATVCLILAGRIWK